MRITMLYTWSEHNIVNQLLFNKKKKNKKLHLGHKQVDLKSYQTNPQ